MQFFFINLLITLVIELCINAYVVRRFWHEGPSDKRVLFANIISNPIAQIIYRSVAVNLWLMEMGVVIFETLFFSRHKKQWGKAFVASLVLNATSVFVGIIVIGFFNTHAVSLLEKCKTLSLNNICVIENADTAPELSELAALRRMNFVAGDFRNYALNLHHLGADYFRAQITFSELLVQCPPLIKDGCIHGYVMQIAYEQGISKAKELCRLTEDKRLRFGCMHALGHSYLEQNDFSVSVAEKNFCSLFAGTDYRACVSGLFHEFTKGGTNTNHDMYYHTHKVYIAPDCSTFSGDMINFCYAAQGSFRQYYPDSESLKTTYAFCDTAPTVTAQSICRDQAHERIQLSKGYSVIIK